MDSPAQATQSAARSDISVLVCTYNRAADLGELLTSALAQETGGEFSYEILIVDNNSTDHTRIVSQQAIEAARVPVRYFFEPRQGKSHALNTALQNALGAVGVIGDDDLIFPPSYLRSVWRLFSGNPDISLIGGRIEPLLTTALPDWLTREHFAALALSDFGDRPFFTGPERPVCLLAAAFRIQDILAVGPYHPLLGVSGSVVGGVEDAEIYQRLYRAGRRGLYQPELYLYHKVPERRLTRSYHRRWHRQHGRQLARIEPEDAPHGLRLVGVPGYEWRRAASALGHWLGFLARGDRVRAFQQEVKIWAFCGILWENIAKRARGLVRRRAAGA